MTSEERIFQRRSLVHRSTQRFHFGVLGYVLEVVCQLVMFQDHSFFIAQVLDVAGLWVTCGDLRMQVVALHTCVKLRDNPVARIGASGAACPCGQSFVVP